MKAINRVTLLGISGRDPEIRFTNNGMAVASFTLATSKKSKDRDEQTQWHNIVAFQKTAELIRDYVKKGSKLYIEGELQYQQYEHNGEKRMSTKIIVNDISFLSPLEQTSKPSQSSGTYASRTEDPFNDDDLPF